MRDRSLPPVRPSHTSTTPIDGDSWATARASSRVMFGRFAISMKDLPEAKLTALNFATNTVFGPRVRIASRSDSSKPRISAVMPTIEVMPMTTPRTVSAERILLVRSVSIDIDTISPNNPERNVAIRRRPLLAPQRFDRVQAGRRHRRVEPEEQPDERGDPDADEHRPELHRGWQGGQLADDDRQDEPDPRSGHAAEHRQGD